MEEKTINEARALVRENLGATLIDVVNLGEGGSASVVKAILDAAPYAVAIKLSRHGGLLKEEYRALKFLNDNADFLSPKPYFFRQNPDGEISFLCMQYYDGISAEKIRWSMKRGELRQAFARAAVDNLISLHQTKGEKYGKVFSNESYSSWHDYYYPFAQNSLTAAQAAEKEGVFLPKVVRVMEKALAAYNDVFDEPIGAPALCHGDYWTPNLIASREGKFLGAIDPFQLIWADPEYDLFPLIVGSGKKLKLLELYCQKQKTSQKLPLKNEFYALFSEVYWFTRTHHKYDKFLLYKANCLNRQMKKFLI